MGVEVTEEETEVSSTHTRPVENVAITAKGLQDRKNLLLNGRTVENSGKLILSLFKFIFNHNYHFQISSWPIMLKK